MKRRERTITAQVRRWIGAAGAVAVLLAVAAASAGCAGTAESSGDQGSSVDHGSVGRPVAAERLSADPLKAVRAAADLTGRVGSARTATHLVTRSLGKEAVFTGTGAYDYVKRIGSVSVVLPPGAATKGRMTEVVVPGVVYLQNSGAKVPAGKWVRLDVRQLPDGNLVSSGTTDPATAAGALRGALDARLVGSGTMGGTAVNRYRGTLDLAKAAKATGGRAAAGLRAAASTFTVKKVPYEVWLDGQGRLHKVVEVFTFASVPGSKAAKDQVVVTSTTTLSQFGAPVNAAEPAPAEVYTVKGGTKTG
jgi:hypothetical protein